jgi:hypothetical protein
VIVALGKPQSVPGNWVVNGPTAWAIPACSTARARSGVSLLLVTSTSVTNADGLNPSDRRPALPSAALDVGASDIGAVESSHPAGCGTARNGSSAAFAGSAANGAVLAAQSGDEAIVEVADVATADGLSEEEHPASESVSAPTAKTSSFFRGLRMSSPLDSGLEKAWLQPVAEVSADEVDHHDNPPPDGG